MGFFTNEMDKQYDMMRDMAFTDEQVRRINGSQKFFHDVTNAFQQSWNSACAKEKRPQSSGGSGLGTLLAAGAVLGGLALLGCFSDNDKNNGNNAK